MAVHVPILRFERLEPNIAYEPEATVVEPEPRSGHRIVVDDKCLYAVGGYNPEFWQVVNTTETCYPLFKELWCFSFARRKWKLLNTNGSMPIELASHSALLHGHHLLMYGGTGVPFGDKASNDLNVCNLESLEWKNLKCEGERPTQSYGHAMFLDDDNLYVFGGTTGWHYNSDLHRLHINSRTWTHICTNGDEPPGRYRHEVAYLEEKLYIFGGGRDRESYKMEELPVFDFKTNTWSVEQTEPDTVKQTFPCARRCHSAVQRDNYVYICGGYNGSEIFGDLWQLDLQLLKWTCLPATLPQPVYFHAASITKSGYMVVYGGVTEIDSRRTSQVVAIWLTVPPLKEMTWYMLLKHFPLLANVHSQALLKAGIPIDLIERLR